MPTQEQLLEGREETIRSMCVSIMDEVIGHRTKYDPNLVEEWVSAINERVVDSLVEADHKVQTDEKSCREKITEEIDRRCEAGTMGSGYIMDLQLAARKHPRQRKYVTNMVFFGKDNSTTVQMFSHCFWEENNDRTITVQWENDSLYAIFNLYIIHV